MAKRERPDTGRLKPLSLAPLTVDEALEALLKTPPPSEEQPKKAGKAKRAKQR